MAWAIDINLLKPQGYVSDFAGVIDAAARAELESYLAQLETATGAQVAIVTLPTLEGEPIEDFANDLFRKWGIGKKGTDEGLLLLLAIRDRQSRLEVGRGLEGIIPDGFAGAVLRQMRPLLREGNYAGALLEAAHMLGSRIAEAKGVTLNEQLRRRRPRQPHSGTPWPLVGGAAFLTFLLLSAVLGYRQRRQRLWTGRPYQQDEGILPALILAQLLSQPREPGWRSGGFGGYDSPGGGFGGFGGGDSGGGGASSNW
jgi:uncharacterized protein